jgi:serine/threonine-protein kinase
MPHMLGRYALYGKIASGGMASVHIGRLLGPVGFARTVAIKRMHPQFAEDPDFVSMFLDEARLAARIRHPNVVPTLDVVTTPGELFLVMELVQGESLARLIRAAIARSERIPPEMVATIMVGVLHGLHAAHEAKNDHGEPLGIVHRDVSPHNILVGIDGVARVLDFGIAKAVGRVQTTREGQLKGKLAYMAPEQVRGEGSRTVDVYAAAVVLWETLAAKRLFGGTNEAQLLDQVLRGCDTPPSAHVPGLPRALDDVTMRGLSVDPARRFSTAREMARALEDAIPLATVSKVGDWVEAAAKAALDERSARIADIENDSSKQELKVSLPAPVSGIAPVSGVAPVPRASPRPAPGIEDTSTEATSIAVTEEMIYTELSSGSASAPRPQARAEKGRSRVWLAAAAGGGLLLTTTVIVAFTSRSTTAPAADTTATATPAATQGPASTPTPTPAPTPPEVAASAPSTPTAASASAASKPPAPVPSATQPAQTRPPVSRPPAAAAKGTTPSHCNPPWYFDARGVRIFKPECL